jgi:VCBS repeat-containing protein
MTIKRLSTKPARLALLLAGFGLAHAAQAVDLVAIEGQWSPDGGTTQIPMWGFASDTGQACNSNPDWSIGPQLTDADLDIDGNLVINLRNCLPEPVSVVIPGQPAVLAPVYNGNRVTSFTAVAAENGGTATYTWNSVREGTYLYQSGSHPAKQVQMGLYGALTVGTYADTSADVTLLYSEIDPVLHEARAAATPLGYNPRYFLVNGSIDSPVVSAGDTNQPTVLRMLNAGLDYHVPALNGEYMQLVAEDGNPYPYARRQYSALLPAGKTIDALWLPESAGDHVIYDRRGNNMVAVLAATAGVGAPEAVDDAYAVDEDNPLAVAAPGVLANDTGGTTAILETTTTNGALALVADGSFNYSPDADFNGTDSFTYRANDGILSSSPATVTITVNAVNDAPVAVDDAYEATLGTTLMVAAPGVLANDYDVDGDVLTAGLVSSPTNGTLTLNSDGSFDYTPTIAVAGSDSFTYEACDTSLLCASATVSIDIVAAVNNPPVAVEDTATVVRNTAVVFINLTDNDYDPDGNLKDAFGNVAASQITVTTGTATTRGGTVTVVTNGVNYEPKRNFRGTDTFNYVVEDLDGATSNEVTVRINVVK